MSSNLDEVATRRDLLAAPRFFYRTRWSSLERGAFPQIGVRTRAAPQSTCLYVARLGTCEKLLSTSSASALRRRIRKFWGGYRESRDG